ncbi:uncharacterized protein LOC134343341 [Mobula hypostoma]|uniref:uncharacterized protein LOC134343341 n=1 Tax=Mobula hypostoma TaxID=723540 RepID=UPI002FC2BF12
MVPVFLLVASLVIGADLSESHCLRSDILCSMADYQVRRYKDSVWVGTHVHVSISPKVNDFMQLLIRYTRGENSAGLLIQSNGQFLISFTGDGEIAMYLLLPEELWENPPTPTSPQTFITRFRTMDVFSRRIQWDAMSQAKDFNRTLIEQNVKFNNSFFFVSFCKGYAKRSILLPSGDDDNVRFGFNYPLAIEKPSESDGHGERSISALIRAPGGYGFGFNYPLAIEKPSESDGKDERRTPPPPPEVLRRRSKRSIGLSPAPLVRGGNSFWGPEISFGGVSYDFSSIPEGKEVWFVATGGVHCPTL